MLWPERLSETIGGASEQRFRIRVLMLVLPDRARQGAGHAQGRGMFGAQTDLVDAKCPFMRRSRSGMPALLNKNAPQVPKLPGDAGMVWAEYSLG